MNFRLLSVLFCFVICLDSYVVSAQSEDDKNLNYITVTTLQGVDGFDFEAWKEVEEEYFEKVTSKIDLIKSHEFLFSYFSPRAGEIKVINVIGDWQDIVRINDLRSELIEEAWPDIDERNAFFEKQNSFYKSKHSDEIYLNSEFKKDLVKEPGQNMPFVYMFKTNILSDSGDENSYDNYRKYVRDVLNENSKILAYYPFNHFWGSDSRQFVEVFVYDTFSDIELSKFEGNALLAQLIPDEQERKDFFTSLYSAIDSQETSFYTNVPTLSK